jgi:hypothetical protein
MLQSIIEDESPEGRFSLGSGRVALPLTDTLTHSRLQAISPVSLCAPIALPLCHPSRYVRQRMRSRSFNPGREGVGGGTTEPLGNKRPCQPTPDTPMPELWKPRASVLRATDC